MTKLLILSDSHNSTGAVERILHAESDATAVIFLGDGLRDLEEALTLHPKMKVYAVAGNCDFGALEPLDGLASNRLNEGATEFLRRLNGLALNPHAHGRIVDLVARAEHLFAAKTPSEGTS